MMNVSKIVKYKKPMKRHQIKKLKPVKVNKVKKIGDRENLE